MPNVLLLTCIVVAFGRTAGVSRAETNSWKPDRILITFWSPPPATDEALTAVKAQGYNLTWTPESGLDVAHRHGLKAMLQDDLLTPATLDKPEQRARLDALIARVRRHPALEAYFITDEPGASDFAALGRLVDYLRKQDPSHFAYINLFPTYANNQQLGTQGDTIPAYADYLRLFQERVQPQLLSYDHYHFFKMQDGKEYFLNLGLVRQAALQAHIPFVNIIQACTIEPSWRLVNANELRWLVYTTLAYGARGINYFLYWGPSSYGGLYQDGKKTPLVDIVARLNGEIAALSSPLMSLETLGVYHTMPLPDGGEPVPTTSPVQFESEGEFVLGLFGRNARASAFMVVNRSYKSVVKARIRLAERYRHMEEYDRSSQRWRTTSLPPTKHILNIELGPGDGRLFRFAR